ncbi:MAG: hypothetical protein JXR68_12135 [Bacteroidales bacterium]|nr:hypothetical protein [Bacteroidales bacterium]
MSNKNNISDFGPVYNQFENKPIDAIKYILSKKEGQAVKALYREDTGFVDIIWGENDKNNKGFGLKHIVEKHGKDVENLGFSIESFITVLFNVGSKVNDKQNKDRFNIVGEKFKLVISEKWNGKEKRFLLTAFEIEKRTGKAKSALGSLFGVEPLSQQPVNANIQQKSLQGLKFDNKIYNIGVGGLELTIDSILEIIKDYRHSIINLSQKLKGENLQITAFNIWNFIKQNTTYTHDKKGIEELRTPERLIYDKIGDCDDYTIFAASVLLNLGYKPQLYVVAFNNNPNYGHIYLSVDNIVIDGVMNEFNKHPENITQTMIVNVDGSREIHKKNAKMIIQKLNGIEQANNYPFSDMVNELIPTIGGVENDTVYFDSQEMAELAENYIDQIEGLGLGDIEGLGKIKDWFKKAAKKVKEKAKKVKEKVKSSKVTKFIKKTSFAPIRGAYLLLLKLNFLKQATMLYVGYMSKAEAVKNGLDIVQHEKLVAARKKFENFWQKAGGNIDVLKKAVSKGRGVKVFEKKGLGVVTAAASAAAVGSAATFWGKLKDWFKGIDLKKMFSKAKGGLSKVKEVFTKDVEPDLEEQSLITQAQEKENDNNKITTLNSESNNLLYVAAAAGLALILILK